MNLFLSMTTCITLEFGNLTDTVAIKIMIHLVLAINSRLRLNSSQFFWRSLIVWTPIITSGAGIWVLKHERWRHKTKKLTSSSTHCGIKRQIVINLRDPCTSKKFDFKRKCSLQTKYFKDDQHQVYWINSSKGLVITPSPTHCKEKLSHFELTIHLLFKYP